MFAFVLLGAVGGLCSGLAFFLLGAPIWLAVLAYAMGGWISLGILVATTTQMAPQRTSLRGR